MPLTTAEKQQLLRQEEWRKTAWFMFYMTLGQAWGITAAVLKHLTGETSGGSLFLALMFMLLALAVSLKNALLEAVFMPTITAGQRVNNTPE